ncbi:hypothetical protein [Streptomyces sp. ITFR-16]|uniref:hypothetical protein n=1 Tax=Streptomyces sp. ITFR-16 TaxID=3075198 RepID=UPI00288ACBE6|nr:hypothetical protein [Streptomyces sp. ITFR-16]WNI24590.1 hypothetical protein RLT58_23010 [Streptomyces sp. ITFR-16]
MMNPNGRDDLLFFLIKQHDALPPWARPNFLESIGKTPAEMERLRALRDMLAAREASESAPGSSPGRAAARRRRTPRPSARRRPRVRATRPPNRYDSHRRVLRRTVPPFVVVIYFKLY